MDLLTDGALEMMKDTTSEEFKPVVQITDLRLVTSQGAERYRVILSDGRNLQQGLLATQLHYLVQQGKVTKGTVVKLIHYNVNYVQKKT